MISVYFTFAFFNSSLDIFPFVQMYPSKAVIMILAITKILAEQDGVYFKIEENTFLSDENAIWSGKAASLLSCSLMCLRQDICKSANFMTDSQTCLTFKETTARNMDMLLPQQESFYVEKVTFLNYPVKLEKLLKFL